MLHKVMDAGTTHSTSQLESGEGGAGRADAEETLIDSKACEPTSPVGLGHCVVCCRFCWSVPCPPGTTPSRTSPSTGMRSCELLADVEHNNASLVQFVCGAVR